MIYRRSDGLKGLDGATALLVVEIADSSLRYDVGRKAALYAGFGIRELWVIDAVRLTLRTFRGPATEGYADVRDLTMEEEASPAFAPDVFALRLAELDIDLSRGLTLGETASWTVTNAKPRLLKILRRRTRRRESLAEFLVRSPLKGVDLDLERIADGPRAGRAGVGEVEKGVDPFRSTAVEDALLDLKPGGWEG